jgi:hypothetical protein
MGAFDAKAAFGRLVIKDKGNNLWLFQVVPGAIHPSRLNLWNKGCYEKLDTNPTTALPRGLGKPSSRAKQLGGTRQ